MNKNRISSFFLMLFLVLSLSFWTQGAEAYQDPLEYRVSVNVMAVPVFAVDNNGNPVYDLKQEELELYVNDKPTNVLLFKCYEFGHEQKVTETVKTKTKPVQLPQPKAATQDRVIFIMLDSMFNSLTGFRRTKEIAIRLIKAGQPGDYFVVLENNPIGGLKYIGGPDREGGELIKKIKKLKAPPEKWNPDLYNSRLLYNSVSYNPMTDPRQETLNWISLRELTLNSERMRYQHQVRHFVHVLSQFKYALKTIDKPKIVFLISEGIATGAFKAGSKSILQTFDEMVLPVRQEAKGNFGSSVDKGFYSILTIREKNVFNQNKIYSAFLLRYLLEIVKSINNGGSVLYTINPRRLNDTNDENMSGEMSLRYLAAESGGKYFAGSKPEKIITRIKKTTAAYYELFYPVLLEMGSHMNVRLKCKRKGVRVHSLVHTERNRPYHRMEEIQKKLFALNVVTGGTWSRIVGKVRKVKYKKLKSTKGKNKKSVTFQVPIPNGMSNHNVDMFLIQMDPKTHKTNIDLVTRGIKDSVNLNIKPRKDKNQFFVIIEPTAPYCIYNKI